MAIRFQRRFYESPLCDEVELAELARNTLAAMDSPPGPDEIRQISAQLSADLAARVFYESVRQHEHAGFCRRLESYAADRVDHCSRLRVLIMPGMLYREHPEVGADGRLAGAIGRKFGFEVEIVPTESAGGVSVNSAILARHLDQDSDRKIWLLSLSKGTSEVRHYLQNGAVNPAVVGWLNIAGIAKGTPFADDKLSNSVKQVWNRLLCLALRIDFSALTEMRTSHPFWQNEQWPERMEMIHVAPIPLSSHIQPGLRARYQEMRDSGPTDGFVPVTDVLSLPGKIYPVWGSDHFLRSPDVSAIIYRLFNYIADQSNGLAGGD